MSTSKTLTAEIESLNGELLALSAQVDQAEARRDASALDAAEFSRHAEAAATMKTKRDNLSTRLDALRSQLVDAEAEQRTEEDRKTITACDRKIDACRKRFNQTAADRKSEEQRHKDAMEKFKTDVNVTRRELDDATRARNGARARVPQREPTAEEIEQDARRKACEAQLKIVKRLGWDLETIERNPYSGKPIEPARRRLERARAKLDQLEKLCPAHRDRRLRDEHIAELKREQARLGFARLDATNAHPRDMKKMAAVDKKIAAVKAELAEV